MGFDTSLTRQEFLGGAAAALAMAMVGRSGGKGDAQSQMKAIEESLGLKFSDEERKKAEEGVKELQASYRQLSEANLGYGLAPATTFIPVGRMPKGSPKRKVRFQAVNGVEASSEGLTFLPVGALASLLKSRKLTSAALTEASIARLKKHGDELKCVVSLLEDEAREEAARADKELAAGKWRGPLHGIPYAIKDLFDSKGHRTTWGAEPFKDRVASQDSAVVEKMREAGAVLVVKATLGALAMNDQWFGGMTRNPWNPEEGSSGSSAGSASAVAAGLVPVAIGTETLGSIVSPSHRCRVTGLRPTYGRVSRHGAMALSWTMDKVGPIGRTAEDCLYVLDAIRGGDPRDLASVDMPLGRYQGKLSDLKVAVLEGEKPLDEEDTSHQEWIPILESLGVKPVKLKVTPSEDAALMGLSIEAAAAFEEITRSGEVNRIERSAWPDIFRAQMYASAVEHMQSLRLRRRIMDRFEQEFGDFDLIVAGDRGSHLLITTNLTGHPQLYVPLGPDGKGRSRGLSVFGRLYEEGKVCALGQAIQMKSGFYKERPPKFR